MHNDLDSTRPWKFSEQVHRLNLPANIVGENEFEVALKQMHNGYTEHLETPESPLAAIRQLIDDARSMAINEVVLLNPDKNLELPDD